MVKMMSQLRLLLLVCLLAGLQMSHAAEVRVAVAANFVATLKALAPLYEKKTGDQLIISSGSSGKLYAQIINGAPYDVFLSADRNFSTKLVDKQLAFAETRYIYATGVLVLWGLGNAPIDENRLDQGGVKRIAIANPNTAPYGAAARQALKKMRLWRQVKHKLVQGESVGQTFQFAASGNAQLGFVAMSQVLNPNNHFNRNNYWRVPADDYAPLQQEAVLLAYGKENLAAKRFLEFLKHESARGVIAEYGYL